MKPRIKKAIFPVAGLGTRFLPATKSIPKEMLPLVDRPLVQYAVDEAREAGIDSFLFVSALGKSAISDYFDKHPNLEAKLHAKGSVDLLEKLQSSNIPNGSTAYLRQGEPLGLGHAVGCARNFIDDDEFFAVLLPDDVIKAEPGCLKQMVRAWEDIQSTIVGSMQVPLDQVSKYGILDVEEQDGRILKARGMVEKPSQKKSPSQHAILGRYILSPHVMRLLKSTKPGVGNEIQLTDAINAEAASGRGVYGYQFEGQRYDCGSMAGFLKATVDFGLQRPELKEELADFLRATLKELDKK